MTADAKGFQKFTSSHNKLDSNSTIEIDAALAVGAETQTVEVTGTASVLQTQSGAVQSEVNGQQVQNQELNGRSPIYMAQLLPGVRGSSSARATSTPPSAAATRSRLMEPATQDTAVTFDSAPAVRTRGNGATHRRPQRGCDAGITGAHRRLRGGIRQRGRRPNTDGHQERRLATSTAACTNTSAIRP